MTGHVIGLDLSYSQLYGTLHSNTTLFLLDLPHLQTLNLACNQFRNSRISPHFGRFPRLKHLNLSSSQFSGNIPSEIMYLSKLISLDLSCYYGGKNLRLNAPNLKGLVQNLTELRQLSLDGVNMSMVQLGSLRNLSSSLASLSLQECDLRGKFPNDIFRLPNLQKIQLWENLDLIGYLPKLNWSSSLKILALSSTGFFGEVPDSIGNLQSLNYLGLSYCNFSGSIPASLGNLTQITHLYLGNNHFTGEIPSSLSNLSQLQGLFLSGFNLNAHFQSFIFNLTQLVGLVLSNCPLMGPTPSLLLPNLEWLGLRDNSLNGTIPYLVFSVPLMYLDLSNNQLTGQIPISIFQLKNLSTLRLSSNNLSGIVEMQEFSKLQNLVELDLSYNSLSLSTDNNVNFTLPKLQYLRFSSCNLTEFPNFLRNQDTLLELDLSHNKIQGSIPKWVWDIGKDSLYYLNLSSNYLTRVEQLPWKNLQYLDFRSNLLHGEIPSSICNMSSLDILDLSNNSLSGVIPECLGNFSNSLTVLDLRMNGFHGSIPQTFKKGNRLRNIALNGNQLEGPVPQSLINCRNLKVLDLGNNKINDTFPYWLETLPKLHVFVLRSNRFHGSISSSKAKHQFPKLRIFDLSNNDFNGPLPMRYFKNLKAMMNVNEVGTKLNYIGDSYYQDSVILMIKGLELKFVRILTTLTTIDLSNNNFQGEIPKSIGKLHSLRVLNFSHNNLMGHIPTMLENLRVLESLDLSSNNLNGEIPGQLTSLTFLAFLNLSQNHLVGRILQGNQFNTFQNDSYFGNWGLCGVPLSKECNYDEASSPPHMVVQEEEDLVFTSGFGWKVVLMGYGCGMIFGMVMGYRMFLTGKPKWLVRIIEEEILEVVRWRNRNARRCGRRRIYQIQAAFLGLELRLMDDAATAHG